MDYQGHYAAPPLDTRFICCDNCGKKCRAAIRLLSHRRRCTSQSRPSTTICQDVVANDDMEKNSQILILAAPSVSRLKSSKRPRRLYSPRMVKLQCISKMNVRFSRRDLKREIGVNHQLIQLEVRHCVRDAAICVYQGVSLP